MEVLTARLYDHRERDARTAGYRVLVDRLWPRGVKKESLDLDEWDKDVAPSNELRKEFHSGGLEFAEFTDRYRAELTDSPAPAALLDRFAEAAGTGSSVAGDSSAEAAGAGSSEAGSSEAGSRNAEAAGTRDSEAGSSNADAAGAGGSQDSGPETGGGQAGPVLVLLYGAKDPVHNHAEVLADFLRELDRNR